MFCVVIVNMLFMVEICIFYILIYFIFLLGGDIDNCFEINGVIGRIFINKLLVKIFIY